MRIEKVSILRVYYIKSLIIIVRFAILFAALNLHSFS